MARNIAIGKQDGFTYLVLLMIVAISGAALGVVSEFWWLTLQREKEAELIFVGEQYRRAIERYRLGGRFPKSLDVLLGEVREEKKGLGKSDGNPPVVQRYLRRLYPDPITNSTNWGTVLTTSGEIVGVYSQSKERPIKQAGFSERNAKFEKAKYYSDWVFLANGAPVADAANFGGKGFRSPGSVQPQSSRQPAFGGR